MNKIRLAVTKCLYGYHKAAFKSCLAPAEKDGKSINKWRTVQCKELLSKN